MQNSCITVSAIHYNWVFDNVILADELFTKALPSLKTGLLVNNDLHEKLISSLDLPITFDKRFKVTSVPFCIPDFNLLSGELDNFTLCYVELFYIDIILKETKI